MYSLVTIPSIIILCLLTFVQGGKILFFVGGISSLSHRGAVQPLANKLASRGHDVTFLSPYDTQKLQSVHPSIKELRPEGLSEYNTQLLKDLGDTSLASRLSSKFSNDAATEIQQFFAKSHTMCKIILNSPNFLHWLQSAGQYDLVIIDNAVNECAFGVAYYLGAKTILHNALAPALLWDFEMFALPPEFSWLPGLASAFEGEMTFKGRLLNSIGTFVVAWVYKTFHLPVIDQIVRDSIGKLGGMKGREFPCVREIIRNNSIMLVNAHYSDTYPMALPPFKVNVGGMTLDEIEEMDQTKRTLPADIAKFIQNGKDGFIYISFGTLVPFLSAPPELIQVFMETFKKFPNFHFLFKWDGNVPQNDLKNVLFRPWFPQVDILAQPKIRGFVTQGGQVSIQQSIRYGVPLLVFPVTADQNFNAKRIMKTGHGIGLELAGLSSTDLQNALTNLTSDPIYAKKAKKLSIASRDRQSSGLDTAVWWTEFILRTHDTSFLRPDSMDQPLWLQWSLDIMGFLFVILLALLCLLLIAILLLLKCGKWINKKISKKSEDFIKKKT